MMPSVTAANDAYSMHQGGTIDISAPGILANDTTNNGPLTASLVSGPSHASTATVGSTGRLFYRLAPGSVGTGGVLVPAYVGTDSLVYQATDHGGATSDATVNLTITDTPPTVSNTTLNYSVATNSTLYVSAASGLLTASVASDADGDTLIPVSPNGSGGYVAWQAGVSTSTAHGHLWVSGNGQFTYTPTTGYSGWDSFQFAVWDFAAGGFSSPVTVYIDVGSVPAASTSTGITSGTNPSVHGQPVTFTATVTSSVGTPTGDVSFLDGTTLLGTGTLSGGVATFTTSALSTASHTINADYPGTTVFAASSGSVTQTVNQASTTTTVDWASSYSSPTTFGQGVKFKAVVTASSPGSGTVTGNVSFYDGTTLLETDALVSGVATTSLITTLSAGNHTITANYSSTTDFFGSFSSGITHVVNQASSTTTLTSSTNPSNFGDSVTFTATVSAASPSTAIPSGAVTFKDGSTTLDTESLNSSGVATYTTSSLTGGSHSITAVYNGTSDVSGSTSSAVTQVVKVTVQFDISSSRIYETGDDAVITVDLAQSSNQDITVDYATSDGTGVAGVNYTTTSGTLTISAGQTSGTFDVPILDNNGSGTYPATVNLTLSNPNTYAYLGSPYTATLYIDGLYWVGGPTFAWSQTPVAPPDVDNPGPQSNAEGDAVDLPIGATDPNGYTLSYDAVNLPAGLAIDSGTGVISGTVDYEAAEDFDGAYPVTVIVANDQGGSSSISFDWTISDTPRPPVVTNPGSQSSTAGAAVSLPINASQPDGDALSFDASGLPLGLSIDSGTGLISGTIDPSAGSNTAYSVTVTVTDDTTATSQTASQTFAWTVGAGVPGPLMDSPGDQVGAAGDTVDLALNAGDSGGYPLTFSAAGLPAGLGIDPTSGEITGTLANSAASSTPYSVTILASDGQASLSQTFNWSVGAVGLTNPGDLTNLAGDTVLFSPTATDALSNALSFSATGLPSSLTIEMGTGVIYGTIDSADAGISPYAVTIYATDGTFTASQSFNWTIGRLVLTAPANQNNLEGSTVSLQLSGNDNVASPTFSATGLPKGLSDNTTTGLISGTIDSDAHGESPYQVTVTAADGTYTQSQSFTWSVSPQIALASPGPQNNAVGDAISLALTASDRASGTLTFSASGLPSGLGINSATGVISGTIASGAAGSSPYSVTVTAGDGTYSSSQSITWNVAAISLPSLADQTNLDADVVSLSAAAAYNGVGTLAYSAIGLPTGLSVNSSTGLISGTIANTADADGPFAVTISASDGTSTASQSFNWNVDPRVTIDPVDDQLNVPGDIVSLAVGATSAGSGSPTVTYSASGLPAGIGIDSSTGVISGTITASISSTPLAVTVTADDGTLSVSETFNWSLVPVVLANPGNQATVGGAAVTLNLSADLASGYTTAYSASGLPNGLSINSGTGAITGTLSSGDTGNSYVVTIGAVAGGVTSSQEFVWQIGTVVVASNAVISFAAMILGTFCRLCL